MRSANGFLRQFAGDAAKGAVEVVTHEPGGSTGDGQVLHLELVNNGGATARVTVTDGYARGAQTAYQLKPGQRRQHVVHLRASHGRYDVAVTSDQDPSFLRRLAGHVENGRPSVSDPALITG